MTTAPLQKRITEYVTGSWFQANTVDEMEAFYISRLPAIREAARKHGYAIGLHGSMRRDFDLMAFAWREDASDKDTLARAIHEAACGINLSSYSWEQKPLGRLATSFPVCWCEWHDMISAGHVDLSVAPIIKPAPSDAEVRDVRSYSAEDLISYFRIVWKNSDSGISIERNKAIEDLIRAATGETK